MKPAQLFVSATAMLSVLLSLVSAADIPLPAWKHLSSRNGDLPVPNGGTQQTSCITFDIDGDGVADIVLAERTEAPAVIWLRHTAKGWEKYIIDDTHQRPEAGPCAVSHTTSSARMDRRSGSWAIRRGPY